MNKRRYHRLSPFNRLASLALVMVLFVSLIEVTCDSDQDQIIHLFSISA